MTAPQRPASNSDARKRADAVVAIVRAKTLTDVAATLLEAVDLHPSLDGLDTHDAGYVDGWNAAARYFAAECSAIAAVLEASS